jgi:hypothetical protein
MSARINNTTGSNRGGSRGLRWVLWSSLAVVAACGSAVAESPSVSGYSSGSGGDSSTTSTGSAGMEGLPCDVAALLASKCVSCHSDPPVANAPQALVSYANLIAPAKSDPSKSAAALALTRMKSMAAPMPPAPAAGPSAAEIAAFEAWVTAGTPMGTCGGIDAGPDPDAAPSEFDAPATCTSMTISEVDDGAAMRPGVACNACHNGSDKDGTKAPDLVLGGTVYATPHEPDDCNAKAVTAPSISKAVVEVTDKNGVVTSLMVNAVGNFYQKTSTGPVALPYTAKLLYDGKVRAMVASQMSGDCNSCHTQAGTQNAPGRILLP